MFQFTPLTLLGWLSVYSSERHALVCAGWVLSEMMQFLGQME